MSSIDYRLEDFWQPEDVRPGLATSLVPTSFGDPASPEGQPEIDFSPAFNRLLASLMAAPIAGGYGGSSHYKAARIRLDERASYHFYSAITVAHPVALTGFTVPLGGAGTRLRFHGCAGLALRRSGAKAIGRCLVEGLSLEYEPMTGRTPDPTWHGLSVYWTSTIRDLSVMNFPGHGVHFEGDIFDTSIENGNVSLSSLKHAQVYGSGLSGVWVRGHDASEIVVENVNSLCNGRSKIDSDGYGFYDESQLGNSYISCHTRNNHLAGYRATWYKGVSPNRSLFLNCYTERAPAANPATSAEGPPILDSNALVITSKGDGSLVSPLPSVPGRPVATVMHTSTGRLYHQGPVTYGSTQSLQTTLGMQESPPGISLRGSGFLNSNAYGEGDVNSTKLYQMHDPFPDCQAVGWKTLFTRGPMPLGVTDGKHTRPNTALAQNGLLLGSLGDGPRRLGYHDPRYEVASPQVPPAATLGGKFVLDRCLPGDLVFNARPGPTYNFVGWICTIDATGIKKWCRFGEGSIGSPVG